ncbi:MAG: GNAT family N-acetyltransferase [Cryobacterium sp.]|uniref:GNAT family N-acetyltransferase n=1 Tax=unclassified Cryobacterium TaxID=2649013 RepID=UPI0018CB74CC|nr:MULTISPECIES: GNAT family N-acetyltransferase [unclassified Cryobacterium]MCY7404151.1 GNAT family N-acetyltransferase [Cryobacterium sp.]MEC5154357.1 N-acetylglutamate synthase-like GNAT family acetyltransferase [Cryobacterium sp. CAN_C3]
MDTLTFRRATTDDVPALLELVTSAYRGEASRQGWTTEADLIDGQRLDADILRADLDRAHSFVILGERGVDLVGCAHIEKDVGDTAYFGMFAVRPIGQSQGDGKRILAEAERQAVSEWRSTAMVMTVISVRDSLIAFYERRGYQRTGVQKPFHFDTRFGVPKRDDLHLEVLEKVLQRT